MLNRRSMNHKQRLLATALGDRHPADFILEQVLRHGRTYAGAAQALAMMTNTTAVSAATAWRWVQDWDAERAVQAEQVPA